MLDRLDGDAVLRPFLGGEVEQHGFDAGVGEVRGDLRAHHAGAQHGGFADSKDVRHGNSKTKVETK